MNFIKIAWVFTIILFFTACKPSETAISKSKEALKSNYLEGNSIALNNINDTTFVNLKNFSSDFVLDMKYATNDNFLKQAVYDCEECYLRYKTIKNLIEANADFMKLGLRIKLFDCYRPLDVQKKMWKLVPNPNYVADPSKGSIHNRGGAVDITLVDKNGKELDMGTTFDFFGEEASHNYPNLPEEIKKNRLLLKEIMLQHNFKSFDSEWWHYNLTTATTEKLANFIWKCP